jgi:PAS domain S-box-containing protein
MNDDPKSGFDLEDDDQIPRHLRLPTESITLASPVTTGLTYSGSFDLREVQTTSLGKLLQALPIPALVIDRLFAILFSNQACRKISPNYETTIGTPFVSLFPDPASSRKARSIVQSVFSSRKSSIMESALAIDDNRIWARMNFRSLRLGRDRCILVLVEDLTLEKRQLIVNQMHQEELRKARDELEKRVAERTVELVSVNQSLRETERRQKALLDNIPDMAWLKDSNCNFIAVNQPFGLACGFKPEELTGKTDFDVWPRDLAERSRVEDLQVIESRSPKRVEELITDADGNVKWLETIKTPIVDESGDVIGTTGIARDITRRKRFEEHIQQSLREKEALLQEVHHRVKNNLQIISSLLGLQAASVEDERAVDILRDSRGRIRSMAFIHEKLYESKDLAKIDFSEYIRDLTAALMGSYSGSASRISLKLDLEEVHLGVGTALPCGLIINELVSNCIKHAFPDGRQGEIRIALQSLPPDKYELIVADNGAGLPKELDYRKSKSLGLRLVTNLTELQLSGTLDVQRSNGTEVKIVFEDRDRVMLGDSNGKPDNIDS